MKDILHMLETEGPCTRNDMMIKLSADPATLDYFLTVLNLEQRINKYTLNGGTFYTFLSHTKKLRPRPKGTIKDKLVLESMVMIREPIETG